MVKREESPLMEYLRQRMEIMERELIKERERALSSENLLKQQEALRTEVEEQLKKIGEQLRKEKAVRDLEEGKEQSEARVQALEKRLDEMNATWADLIKDSIKRQEAGAGALIPELHGFTNALDSLKQDVRALKEGFTNLNERVSPIQELRGEVEGLRTVIPSSARRREEEEKALRDELRGLADRIGETLLERFTALDRRVASEIHEHQERLSRMTREREAMRETVEEQHHNIRQEHAKERIALETQFNDQIAELKNALEALAERHGGTADSLSRVSDLSKKMHAIMTQPAKAKDLMIQELENEKAELMAAVKQRTEQLRAFTLERREVERGMGESLMDLTRQLEAEKAHHQQTRSHISSLEGTIEALRADADLLKKDIETRDARFRSLASERDALILSLTEEAEKVRRQIEERAGSDRRWEGKILDFQKLVDLEREKRVRAEEGVSDLRAQIQTLSDHMSKILRDKEGTDQKSTAWAKERADIEAALRKKDDMIRILSSTFQNLLKKP